MGSNLTESALQRAARSVTTLHQVCGRFDSQSGVPCRTVAHSTKSDRHDVSKVVSTVIKNNLLVEMGDREHKAFKGMNLNPLHKLDVSKVDNWIKRKKKEYLKYQGSFRAEVSTTDIECSLAPIDEIGP